MTLAEAARALGLSPETLRWQVHNKRLKARKTGNLWVVTEAEVERYRRENQRIVKSGRPAQPGEGMPTAQLQGES